MWGENYLLTPGKTENSVLIHSVDDIIGERWYDTGTKQLHHAKPK